MAKRLQVIVYGKSLNMAGIAASLKAEAGLDVICIGSHTSNFWQSIDGINPVAIAFDLSDPAPGLDFRMLRGQPDLLLIGVDPCSDEMLVFSSHSTQAFSSADIVKLIHQTNTNL